VSAASEVVVLEHQEDDPAGLIGEWLDARGIAWSVVRPADAQPDPGAPAAIVSLGSSHSAYAAEPGWIAPHGLLLRAAIAADTPVLGVCFGAQALALAAGGEVVRASRPELGWVHSESEQPELAGDWLAWHFDSIVTVPAGGVPMACSPDAVQAFRFGRSLAVQFHPEVDAKIWGAWTESERELVGRYVGDPDCFLSSLEERASELRTRVFSLLDWWYRALVGS
jgi:GMP synthase-like glutamine amidotransferase